jgi:uncharacterized lipoprotein YddW (UPF0748 family)
MRKQLSFNSKSLLAICCVFTHTLLYAQITPVKKKYSEQELLKMADNMIQSDISVKKMPNGDVLLQRKMDDYLKSTVLKANAQAHQDEDYGHDHKDAQLIDYLNREHPSVKTLKKYFTRAAVEFNTPQRLLEAIAMVQSNWTQMGESMYGSWGVMGLVENQFVQQITEAAALLKVSPQQIKDDARINIRAAAALLAKYHKGQADNTIEDWFAAAKKLTGLHNDYYEQELAKRFYDVINEGATTISLWREMIHVQPMTVNVSKQLTVPFPVQKVMVNNNEPTLMAADYSGAILNLTTCNFSSRNGAPIEYYFVHYVATGTYEGAISWFKNCTSQVSAHYVIRNSDGQITQVVMESDRAWSQGVSLYNDRGIGTEHEVLSSNLSMWYSDPMLTAGGTLANNVCTRRNIPKIRAVAQPGINGHSDVKSTSCPNMTQEVWNLFMAKVNAAAGTGTAPTVNNDATRTDKGRSIVVDVLSNDVANGTTINLASVAIISNPVNGTTSVNTTNGKITYTPNASFTGTETFTYKVANSGGVFSTSATVQVQVISTTACGPSGAEITPAFPKRDMRGAWISTVANIDWPSSRTAAPSVQMAELKTMLDTLASSGINSVFFQVRPESDALYASTIEPWSYYLTGQQGVAPSTAFDPLSFIVTEAHARGMELHAWVNPYRAKQGTPTLAANHVATLHPDWTFVSGAATFLNPGLPSVRNHVVNVVADIASRYDIDGIHFDDYFYPYAGMGTQDATTYTNNNPTNLGLADWRRNNVNQLVTLVYDKIQQINTQQKKSIRFGISPFGIWKSGTPAGITGLSSFSDIYCDPIAWLQAGKVDYLAPQLYWPFGGGQDYAALSAWWDDQLANYGRHLYPGLGLYRLVDGNWPASTIQAQIDENRKAANEAALGQIFFTTNDLTGNDKNIKTLLQQNQYKYKALPPAMYWKDNICPVTPSNLTYQNNKLRWNKSAAAADGDLAKKYVVYKFNSTAEVSSNAQDGTKIIGITTDTSFSVSAALVPGSASYFVVTAVDKSSNESLFSTALAVGGSNQPCTPTLTNVIVDAGSPGYSTSAGWVVSTSSPGYQGTNYYHDNNDGKATKWVSYSPQIGGVYDVYTWYVAGTNRATNSLFRIKHTAGTNDVTVNQQTNNATWVYLGRYTFTSDIVDKVQLRNDGSNGYVIADAVRFALAGCPGGCITPFSNEKIVDDVSASFMGSWTAGANAGYYGTGYKHDGAAGAGTKSATYTPNLQETGSYELFAYYLAGSNRATNALVEVNHMNGTTNVSLNQQVNGSVWTSLGTYNFTKGAGTVVIKNNNANGVVIADAFRWVYKGCATAVTTAPSVIINDVTSSPALQKLMVYPNPFVSQLQVNVSSLQKGRLQTRLIDVTGRIVVSNSYNIEAGNNQLRIDGSALRNGVYMVEAILPNGERKVMKVMKQ